MLQLGYFFVTYKLIVLLDFFYGELWDLVVICSVELEDYVTENDTNYGSKYNNFNKLVSIIDREILSKLNSTSNESSSTLPSR